MNEATRQQDNKTKRLLSLLLAAIMLVSMFSINVSAVTPPTSYSWNSQNLTNATLATRITNLSPEERNAVTTLYINNNEDITDLTCVFENFPNLHYLSANSCSIRDLRCFSALTSTLTHLRLNNNDIVDVTPLGNLGYAIEKLYLNNNLITNINPLVFTSKTVAEGKNYQYNLLDLSNNYISDTAFFDLLYFKSTDDEYAKLIISNNYIILSGTVVQELIVDHGLVNFINEDPNTLPTNPADLYVMDENNEHKILSYFGLETDVEIPASLGATTIDFRAFKDNRYLETLKIPDAVTTIGYGAFDSCLNLKRVDFGTGLTQIDSMAFNYCYSLLGAALPDSIQTVSENAFRKCYRLKNVCFSNPNTAVDNEAFHYCDPNLLTINVNPNVPSGSTLMNSVNNLINDSATIVSFSNITTDFTVTDGVLTACTDDSSKLVLPNGIQSVNVSTFNTPANMDSVIIPEGVTSLNLPINVGTNALSVLLPNTLQSVGNFVNNTADLTVYSKAANTVAAQYAASSTGFDLNPDYDISYDTLNSYTGTGVTTLTIPSNLNIDIIGASAFFNKDTLTTIILPSGISEIETLAFRKCYALTNLDLNDDGSLKVISSLAISDCNALEDIEIPESAQILGAYALESCNLLETVSFGTASELVSIGESAFESCPALPSIAIPSAVTAINKNTFLGCTALSAVSLNSNGVTTIGEGAFESCSALASIAIPSTVTEIQTNAFYNCSSLATVSFNNSSLTKIGKTAFANCPNLNNNDSNNQDMFTLPENLEKLESGVFQNCTGLVSISLPTTFTEEEQVVLNAFEDCSSALKIYCTQYYADDPINTTPLWNKMVNDSGYTTVALANTQNNNQLLSNMYIANMNINNTADEYSVYKSKQAIIDSVTSNLYENSSSEIDVNELTDQIAINMLLAEH